MASSIKLNKVPVELNRAGPKKRKTDKRDNRAAKIADYYEKKEVFQMISNNISGGGCYGVDVDDVFPEDYETQLEHYLKREGGPRSATDAAAPDVDVGRGEFQVSSNHPACHETTLTCVLVSLNAPHPPMWQDDFEAVGVKSRAQFEEWAAEMPATLLGVLRGEFEGQGSVQQRATVLMLGWQLGCELTEWMGGVREHFAYIGGERDKDLENVEEVYKLACSMLGMEPSYI